jgi:hypothetical protein
VGGDLPSLLTGIIMSSAGTGAVPIGNYTITIGGGIAANYALNYIDGVLTVLADPVVPPPTPPTALPPGGLLTIGNVNNDPAAQSSLLLTLLSVQDSGFSMTTPPVTSGTLLSTTALVAPTASAERFTMGEVKGENIEIRTYRAAPITPTNPITPTTPIMIGI